MSRDPVAPLLAPKHYVAIERRLVKILRAVHACILNATNVQDVIRNRFDNPNVATETEQKHAEDKINNEKKKPADDEIDDDDDADV
jgi:hypothetical protein